MNGWSLQRVWLSEVSGDCVPEMASVRSLDVVLDIDALSVEQAPSGAATVTAEIAISLSDSGDTDTTCDLAAAFSLLYKPEPGGDLTALATQTALRDAWPTWRAWAIQTLALMEISAPGLPAVLPPALIDAGGRALSLG